MNASRGTLLLTILLLMSSAVLPQEITTTIAGLLLIYIAGAIVRDTIDLCKLFKAITDDRSKHDGH